MSVKRITNLRYTFDEEDLKQMIKKHIIRQLKVAEKDIQQIAPIVDEDSKLRVEVYIKPKTEKL